MLPPDGAGPGGSPGVCVRGGGRRRLPDRRSEPGVAADGPRSRRGSADALAAVEAGAPVASVAAESEPRPTRRRPGGGADRRRRGRRPGGAARQPRPARAHHGVHRRHADAQPAGRQGRGERGRRRVRLLADVRRDRPAAGADRSRRLPPRDADRPTRRGAQHRAVVWGAGRGHDRAGDGALRPLLHGQQPLTGPRHRRNRRHRGRAHRRRARAERDGDRPRRRRAPGLRRGRRPGQPSLLRLRVQRHPGAGRSALARRHDRSGPDHC